MSRAACLAARSGALGKPFNFHILSEGSVLFVLAAVTPTLQVPTPQEQIPLGLTVITQRLRL